jgi:L-amino acid N-acyltransferase
MDVRRATSTDIPRIFEIFNYEISAGVNAFDTQPIEGAAQQVWFDTHRDPRFPLLVSTESDNVIGWASLSPWAKHGAYARTAEISVFIDHTHRGRGVGRAVLGRLIDEGREGGHHVLLARVEASNVASRRLHVSHSFAEVGVMREVGWKHGRYLDVILFQMML